MKIPALLTSMLGTHGKKVSSPVHTIRHLSATIAPAGTSIAIVYSRAVRIGPGGSGGHTLTLTGGPVTMTYLSGSGTTTLTYSLNRTVSVVESGTLAYVQPVSGIEENVYGVDVVSFSGFAVINSSAALPAPGVLSATINAAGTSIALLYSAAVRIGTSGAGGHTLTMSGGAVTMTYASGGDTTTLTYVLNRAVSVGETGTLAFAQPSNGIEALANGTDVNSFSGAAVTNSSTAPPTVVSAAINSAGTSLTITTTTAVRIGAGGNGGHVLTASGGASALAYASGSGTTALVYTLARAVIAGESTTLAYTQPGNGVEANASPNPDLATYSGRVVTNASTLVAPTQTSASIDVTGVRLSIVFSQNVTFGAGGNGGHTLAINPAATLAYVSGAGTSTLVYGLSRVINQGEACTLSYTQPGSGVEAVASLADVATFATRPVTNNSTVNPSTEPTWNLTVPTISFVEGATGASASHDLVQYTDNFNVSLHEMQIADGSSQLPTGVSLNPTGLLVYNSTAPAVAAVNVQIDIEDKAAPAYLQLTESEDVNWYESNTKLYTRWTNQGGDWRDAADVANGTTAYALGTVTGFSPQTVNFSVAALATRLLQRNTGIHVRMMPGGGTVDISSRTGAQAPTLQIVTNAGTFNCPCTISFWISSSSNQSLLGPTLQPVVLLKFDLSGVTGTTVVSATMTLGIETIYAGANPRQLAANYLDMPRLIYSPATEVGGVVQGIANSVVQDTALAAHPSVIIYDDLVNDDVFFGADPRYLTVNLGIPTAPAAGHYYEPLPQYGLTALVVKGAASSPHVVDAHKWCQNESSVPQAGAVWKKPYVQGQELGYTHLFFRYLMWIGEDLAPNYTELGMKLSAIQGRYNWTSSGASTSPPPSNAYNFDYRGWHSAASAANPNLYHFATYEYDVDHSIGQFSGVGRVTLANLMSACLKAGRWYCIEQEIQLNSLVGNGGIDPGGIANINPDGIERWWIDGVKVYEFTNLRIRGTKEVNIQTIPYLHIYHGGTGLPAGPFTYKLAGVCVATQYIGPPKVIA
jgi:hypothetical protein